MQRVIRLVNVAYVGLFLSYLYWSLSLGLAALPDNHHRICKELSGPDLAGICLLPLPGLLLSHWFVRRSRFWGAAVTLLLCICLSAANLIDSDNWAKDRAEQRSAKAELTRAMAEIPKGADLDAVLKFLQEKRIDHSGYDARFREVGARIPYVSRSWFAFEGGLYMTFWFSREKKLANYKVREEWVAP
jgi:hypothetical protein